MFKSKAALIDFFLKPTLVIEAGKLLKNVTDLKSVNFPAVIGSPVSILK